MRLRMQEWTKGRKNSLTMPLWTWSEMEKLLLHLYQDKVRLTLECLESQGALVSCKGCSLRGMGLVESTNLNTCCLIAGGCATRPSQLRPLVWRRAAARGRDTLKLK